MPNNSPNMPGEYGRFSAFQGLMSFPLGRGELSAQGRGDCPNTCELLLRYTLGF
jgi:hypothetical protein